MGWDGMFCYRVLQDPHDITVSVRNAVTRRSRENAARPGRVARSRSSSCTFPFRATRRARSRGLLRSPPRFRRSHGKGKDGHCARTVFPPMYFSVLTPNLAQQLLYCVRSVPPPPKLPNSGRSALSCLHTHGHGWGSCGADCLVHAVRLGSVRTATRST